MAEEASANKQEKQQHACEGSSYYNICIDDSGLKRHENKVSK